MVHALAECGFIGFDPSIAGLVYAEHSDAPGGALTAVLLNADELRLAKTVGASRVLSRLGEATLEYPFPYTSVRNRLSVALPGDEQSMVMQVPRLFSPNLSLTLFGEKLLVTCVRGTADRLRDNLDQLPTGSGLAFLTNPSSRANGRLVWKPGQDATSAITPPGSSGDCLTGNMLIVAPGEDQDVVRVHEDGFALIATSATWDALQSALVEECDFELPASDGGLALQLEHVDANTYLPVGGVRGPGEIVLLTTESELAAAVDVNELGDYMKGLMHVLSSVENYEIRVELRPDKEPEIESGGELSAVVREGLDTLKPPATGARVAFLLRNEA